MNLNDIKSAQKRVESIIHETPLLTSTHLNNLVEQEVYLKAEHLQKTGAFKIRGATNCVKQAVASGAETIITASSGNHGQAVAYISKELGIKCIVAVPEDASPIKVAAIEGYGAEVVFVGKTSAERIAYAENYAKQNEAAYIPPYDDPWIIAGQGTIGLEILEQVKDIDLVLVPVGGGGLISGIATAIKSINPAIKVIGVEPKLGHDTYLSLKHQQITTIDNPETIADGLRTVRPGQMTFPIVQAYVDEIILVSEADIKASMQFLFERMKQVVEPSGAVTLAAILGRKIEQKNLRIVSVVSGGNIALNQFTKIFN